jgi:hypothetical protein
VLRLLDLKGIAIPKRKIYFGSLKMQSSPFYKHMPTPWEIHPQAPAQVRHILRDSDDYIGSGAFSIVVGVDRQTVLKISTCEASRIILPRLMQQPQEGLPLVYKCFGQVGHVTETDCYGQIPLHAYLVERLHPTFQIQRGQLRTDACPRGPQMCAKTPGDAVGAYNWLERKLCDEAASSEHAPGHQGLHPFVPAVQRALTGTRFSPLIGAIRKLASRVTAGEWKFDVLQRFDTNVLVSAWGEPILSDPVFASEQIPWKLAYQSWSDDSY